MIFLTPSKGHTYTVQMWMRLFSPVKWLSIKKLSVARKILMAAGAPIPDFKRPGLKMFEKDKKFFLVVQPPELTMDAKLWQLEISKQITEELR